LGTAAAANFKGARAGKLIIDNYLDNGLHVPYAHKGFLGDIQLGTYGTEVFNGYSTQSVRGPEGKDDPKFNETGVRCRLVSSATVVLETQ
jgi:phenylpropionate dioxygenase-like ring-hydroxylating dioxygenase large terminal subunit